MKKKTFMTLTMIIFAVAMVLGIIPSVPSEAKTKMPFKGTKTLSSSYGTLSSGYTVKLKSNGRFTMEFDHIDYDEGEDYYIDYGVGSLVNVKGSGKKYTMKSAPIKGYKSHDKNYTKNGVKYHVHYQKANYKNGKKFTLYAPGYKVSSLPKAVRKTAKDMNSAVIMSSDYKTLEKTHGYILYCEQYNSVFCETVDYISSTSEGLITKSVSNIADGIYLTYFTSCKVFKRSGNKLTVTLDTSHNDPYFEIVISGNNTKKTKYNNIKFTLADNCKWSESGNAVGSFESCTKKGNYTASSYKTIKADISSAREGMWEAALEFVVKNGKLVNIIALYE